MIENVKMNRKEFLRVCQLLEAANKLRDGTHTVTLRFEPGRLTMTSAWGGGSVTSDGKEFATGTIAYNHIKRLIFAQGLKKLKKDTVSCILAPGYSKLVVEDGVLKVAFV